MIQLPLTLGQALVPRVLLVLVLLGQALVLAPRVPLGLVLEPRVLLGPALALSLVLQALASALPPLVLLWARLLVLEALAMLLRFAGSL